MALYLADHAALLARPVVPVEGPVAAALRETLARRGAVFVADLARAAAVFPSDVLEALWAMVWAGEVTNDTLEALRSRGLATAGATSRKTRTRPAPRAPRTGPPGSEGRWSLRFTRWAEVSETDRRAALARALLDRYGVVTRECAHAEGVEGGFTAAYDVLKALEDRGRVRRGYFVAGLGGAQFALPGADERLRRMRDPDDSARAFVLAATDPANAYGAILDWPPSALEARPQRSAGSHVVLRDGAVLGWLGRAGRPLLTFLPEAEPERSAAAAALAHALGGGDGGPRAARLDDRRRGRDVEPARARLRRRRLPPHCTRPHEAPRRSSRDPIGGAVSSLHEALLAEIRAEFPGFAIVPKRGDRLQRVIDVALRVVTLGRQRHYLTRYHTVLFGKLYVPDAWPAMDDLARTILLRHERVHLRQRRRMGDVVMAFVYLVPLFPVGLAWGRARIEWEAYTETVRATAELAGMDAARALEGEIVARYTGPDYGWMWPFPATVRRWFREALEQVEQDLSSAGRPPGSTPAPR